MQSGSNYINTSTIYKLQKKMTSHKEENGEGNFISNLLKQAFHGISLTLLSLLLPLSFLLLVRFSVLLRNSKPLSITLYFLVLFLSFARLLFSVAGRSPAMKAPTSIAWAVLSLLQVCVSWGVRATITTTFETIGKNGEGNADWIKRIFLFVGIYEIMMMWRRMFVKPVVDDTVYGDERNEGGIVDRVLMGVSFSVLWIWLLRMEVEPLVFSTGNERLEKAAAAAVGWNGFPLWLVSLIVSMTGVLRVVEVIFQSSTALLKNMHGREKQDEDEDCTEDKV